MSVIAPTERDGCVVGADQAAVGDGDAVGVAAEIGQDMLGRTEWWLGKDDPVLATKLTDQCCKESASSSRASLPEKRNLPAR